jgi:outer membrane protein TolC
MRLLFLSAACCALVLSAPQARAETAGLARPGFLPPDAMVLRALDAAPNVLEAEAMLLSAKFEARVMAAGDYETTSLASVDRRRIRGEGGVAEWSLQISRPLRLPGKAQLDARAGQAGVRAASNSVEDARHQLSLSLARLWVGWLEATERQAIDRDELATYRQDLAAMRRRVELKDASGLELRIVEASVARAEAVLATSSAASAALRLEIDSQFPGLTPPAAPKLSPPTDLIRPDSAWRDVILSRSHEIAIVRDLAEREALLARRARLDRLPDPTVGVRTFNERGGAETGVGVFVSIPFSGPRRSALADRQIANASAALVRLRRMEREIVATADRDVLDAQSGLQAWRGALSAAEQTHAATLLVRRSYQLGETSLAELLVAERQLSDARRTETSARARALSSQIKLALDAHELWLTEE